MKKAEQINLTGNQLSKLAQRKISREYFKKALRDEHFRDLTRILLFCCSATAAAKETCEFTQGIKMLDEKGLPVVVQVDVRVTIPKPITKGDNDDKEAAGSAEKIDSGDLQSGGQEGASESRERDGDSKSDRDNSSEDVQPEEVQAGTDRHAGGLRMVDSREGEVNGR